MISVNTHEAKTTFSALLKRVEEENETILVCRNGHPVAEIHAVPKTSTSELPDPEPSLSVELHYDPTEPLADDELPDACK